MSAGPATLAAAAAAAAAEAAEPAAAPAAEAAEPAAEAAAESAAERADAAVPAAPRAPPMAPPPPPPPAEQDEDDQHDDQGQGSRRSDCARRRRTFARHVVERHAAPSAMRLMIAGSSRDQAPAVLALAELRRDHLADRLAGEAVGDEPFEAVADLDPALRSSTATTISRPLSLPFCADAAAAVLEHLDGVFARCPVGLKCRHGGDDHDVAGGGLQREDAALELRLARRIDDVGEVVDRPGERRRGAAGPPK